MLFKKQGFIVLIFLIFILSIGFASAADDFNESDTLNSDLDIEHAIESVYEGNEIESSVEIEDGPGDVLSDDAEIEVKKASVSQNNVVSASSSKTFADVQTMVNDAKSGDVLKLSGTYTGSGKAISIKKSITIQGTGSGATLDAKKLSRILVISDNVKVTLKNLNFKNAFSDKYDGGAIYSKAKNLNVYSCNFNNNHAYDAGDIYIAKGTCVVKSSTFKKGSGFVEDFDGWDMHGVGCIVNKAKSASFYKCSFSGYVNAILSYNKISFKNCVFKNNQRYVLGLKGTNTFTNCKFANNKAFHYYDPDHIIQIKSGKTTFSKCRFVKNSNYVVEISEKATGVFKKSTFKNNFEKSSNGFNYGTISNKGKLLIVKDKKTTTITKKCIIGDHLKVIPYALAPKFTTSYNSGKIFKFKYYSIYSPDDVVLRVFTAKKYKSFKSSLAKDGSVKFKLNGVAVGSHKYKFYVVHLYSEGNKLVLYKKGTLKITKANTIVKASKITSKAKKTKYFKVSVKNKANKKNVKGVKVKLKVFTGKNYKLYTVKTNKKGVANFNTKTLTKGNHKVVVSSANKNYRISAKSSIKII